MVHVGGGGIEEASPPFLMEIYQASTSFRIQLGLPLPPPFFLKPNYIYIYSYSKLY